MFRFVGAAMVLALASVALPGAARDVVILRGGTRIELASPMVRRGNVMVLTREDGTVFSVPASEIDFAATAALKSSSPTPVPAVVTPARGFAAAARSPRSEADGKARTRLTDDDVRHPPTPAPDSGGNVRRAESPRSATSRVAADSGSPKAGTSDPCQERIALATRSRELRDRPGVSREEKSRALDEAMERSLACDEADCARGDGDACSEAANGLSRRGQTAAAREYIAKACRAGRKLSCDALAAANPALAKMDDIRAQEEQRCAGTGRAAASSCEFVGTLEYRDGLLPQARRHYLAACDGGSGKGCANLAVVEYKLGRSAEVATPLFAKACGLGFTPACRRNIVTVDGPW